MVQPESIPQSTAQAAGEKHDYPLSDDDAEFDRLDQQSRGVWSLMGGRHSFAPVSEEPCVILDIGCGSGAVSISLALKHPSAEVVGIDLTPVPSRHVAPPNLTFLQGDFFELVGKDAKLKEGTAQLVFSRFLTLGMPIGKWTDFITTAVSLAKPGGYVELIDFEMQLYRCTDFHNPLETSKMLSLDFFNALRQAESHRIDMDAGVHLEQRMIDAELEIVQVKKFPMAFGPWLAEVNPDAVDMSKVDQAAAISPWLGRGLASSHSEEQIKQYQAAGIDFVRGNLPGSFCRVWAVLGRKPL